MGRGGQSWLPAGWVRPGVGRTSQTRSRTARPDCPGRQTKAPCSRRGGPVRTGWESHFVRGGHLCFTARRLSASQENGPGWSSEGEGVYEHLPRAGLDIQVPGPLWVSGPASFFWKRLGVVEQ